MSRRYRDIVLSESGLVGFWRLGEQSGTTAYDLAGSDRDGTYTGSYTLAQPGALVNDDDAAVLLSSGASEANVQIGDVLDFPATAAFSLEAWVYPTLVDANARRIFSKEITDGGGTQGYRLIYNTANGVRLTRFLNGASDSCTTSVALSTNAWHHIVGTYDGTNMRIYVDGALAAGPTASSKALTDNAGVLTLGGIPGSGTGSTAGRLDEAAIYNVALTQAQVALHHSVGRDGPTNSYTERILGVSGLQSFWRLAEQSGTVAADSIGAAPAAYGGSYTLAQDGPTSDRDDAVALSPDTAVGYVDAGDVYDFTATSAFSLECWVNPTFMDASVRALFWKRAQPAANLEGYHVSLNSSTGGLRFSRFGAGSSTTITAASAVALNAWSHVVATYDGTNMRLYVNGALVAGPTASAFSIADNASPFRLGNFGGDTAANAGNQLQGRMDDAAVYNAALSAQEILDHYTLGLFQSRAGDPHVQAFVRMAALDGTWETVGQDRRRGIVPEAIQLSSNEYGNDQASFVLKRDPGATWPDLTAYTPIEVWIGGKLVWSGFVWETPTQEGQAGFTITVTCRGWQYHLDDDSYERVYVSSRLTDWQDTRVFLTANLATYTTAWGVDVGSGGIVLSLPTGNSATSGTEASATLDLGPNAASYAKRIVVTYTGGGAATLDLRVAGADTPDGTDEVATLDATPIATTSTTAAQTFTTARRYVRLRLVNTAGATLAGSDTARVQITSVVVVSDTAYESGNASILKASQVVSDAISRGTILLSSDLTGINTTSFNLPEWALDGYHTPRENVDGVNAYHGYRSYVDVNKRMVFEALPASPIFEVGDWSGAEFEDASANAGEEIQNRVIVEGTGPDGTTLRVERTAGQQTGAALTRIASPAPDNPSFDTNTTSWTPSAGTTITRDTTNFDSTPASGLWQRGTTVPNAGDTLTTTFTGTFKAGITYVLTFRYETGAGFYTVAEFGVLGTDSASGTMALISAPFQTLTVAWTPVADRSGVQLRLKQTAVTPIAPVPPPTGVWVDTLLLYRATPTLIDRRGFRRTKILQVASAQTVDTATQIGDVYLSNHKTTPFKGALTTTGQGGVRKVLGGQAVHPAELLRYPRDLIRFSNRIDPDTGGAGRDGRIASVSYDHDKQEGAVQIDSTRDNFERLLERLAILTPA